MHSDDLDDLEVSLSGKDLDWLGSSSPSGITIEDFDAVMSLAIQSLERNCDELIAALANTMKSPLSHLFDQSSPPL